MQNDDDKKLPEDISTNAEYEDVETLDDITDENGQPIDAIEKNQVSPEEEENDAKKQLRKISEGDDNDRDDAFHDEDSYIS
ncbi:MAG TPA: hypothetical protein VL576_01610 [Candidatus Paceibacterota bacterium]|jgi:hypothetical protein|nr:hypothetical protein [Candidatus Paceibacterota bacterium]